MPNPPPWQPNYHPPFPLLKKSRYVHVKVFNRFTCAIMRFTFFLQKRRNTKINHIFKSKDDIMQLSFVIMLISFYYRLENLSHGTTSSLCVRVNYISRLSLITEVDFCSNYLYWTNSCIIKQTFSRISFALKNLIDAETYVLKRCYL